MSAVEWVHPTDTWISDVDRWCIFLPSDTISIVALLYARARASRSVLKNGSERPASISPFKKRLRHPSATHFSRRSEALTMMVNCRPAVRRCKLQSFSSIASIIMFLLSNFQGRFIFQAVAFNTAAYSGPIIKKCCFQRTKQHNTIFRSVMRLSSSSSNNNEAATSSSPSNEVASTKQKEDEVEPPLYLCEGLFAVTKPLGWSSSQVVGKIRWTLEQDAKARGAPDKRSKRRRPWMKVGHGGTLDPLATGVLVIGVGKGTKELQQYLTGSKGYRAGVELGFQTTTLDLDPKGEVVATKPFDHVTREGVETALQDFRGSIQQTPPIFSALKIDGKRLYELGRKGKTAEDVKIDSREVQIYRLDLLWNDENEIPSKQFGIDVECGGGTYIRSLVRDIGIALDTLGTMISLERTKQGLFLPEHCLQENEWTADNVWDAIEASQDLLADFNATESLET
jgi:tRNA pseudouridine55 synthase